MKKESTKANPSVDFQILHIGLVDAVICTRLPIKEAVAKFRQESPSGTTGNWEYHNHRENKSPCPDGQGKTHYHLYC